MPFGGATDAAAVEAGVAAYGAPPGGKAMMKRELEAATEAERTGVYITWRNSVTDAECARVAPLSRCMCGTPTSVHFGSTSVHFRSTSGPLR